MKRLIPVFAAALIGCSHVSPMAVKTLRSSSASYTIGHEQTRHTGEPMVVEEDIVFRKAPVAAMDFQPPAQMGSVYPLIRRGMELVPYGRLEGGEVLYTAEGLRPRTITGQKVSWEYCIAVDLEGRAYGDAACSLGMVRKWDFAPEGLLETKVVYSEGSSRKELVYGGRSGDTIKVVYREFRDSLAAQAFFQELSYDLSASATVRFRGMVMDVAEATNSHIRFTVRSRMDGGGASPAAAGDGAGRGPSGGI